MSIADFIDIPKRLIGGGAYPTPHIGEADYKREYERSIGKDKDKFWADVSFDDLACTDGEACTRDARVGPAFRHRAAR